jgi:hypothetical protein
VDVVDVLEKVDIMEPLFLGIAVFLAQSVTEAHVAHHNNVSTTLMAVGMERAFS